MSDSFVTLWTVVHQAPLPMGFPGQEYWSEFPFPSPGDLSDSGIKPTSPAVASRFFTTEPPATPGLKPTGSFVHGIFQARVLEWGATALSEIYRICVVLITATLYSKS